MWMQGCLVPLDVAEFILNMKSQIWIFGTTRHQGIDRDLQISIDQQSDTVKKQQPIQTMQLKAAKPT